VHQINADSNGDGLYWYRYSRTKVIKDGQGVWLVPRLSLHWADSC